MTPTRTRCRPARPLGAIPASAAMVLGWWLVAHSSGQGWVQAVGDLVAAALAVGLGAPWLALRRTRFEVTGGPADGTAGVAVELQVRVSGPVRLTPVEPEGPARNAGPLVLLPVQRGVYRTLTVEVATAVPFGLQWWSRRVQVPLADPLHISPRPRPAATAAWPPEAGRDGADGRSLRPGVVGDLRAPRPYRPGDGRRLVHWPATAHAGELMARELEVPAGLPAEMVVHLPADPSRAEEEAGRAFATVLALLAAGTPVVLTTDEDTGTRTAQVADRRQAARRFAAAVSRRPPGSEPTR